MFQDQIVRNSCTWVGWYIGWERYVQFTGLVLGWCMALAAWVLFEEKNTTALILCSHAHNVAKYVIVLTGKTKQNK